VKEGDEVMRKILVLSFLVLIASPAWGAVGVEQKLLGRAGGLSAHS
jgi:hypothetical protein